MEGTGRGRRTSENPIERLPQTPCAIAKSFGELLLIERFLTLELFSVANTTATNSRSNPCEPLYNCLSFLLGMT